MITKKGFRVRGKRLFVLIGCLAAMAAGIWPVIELVNRPILVLGLPLVMVWSFAIAMAVTVFLLVIEFREAS